MQCVIESKWGFTPGLHISGSQSAICWISSHLNCSENQRWLGSSQEVCSSGSRTSLTDSILDHPIQSACHWDSCASQSDGVQQQG
jgi:hypothetical protein